MAKKTTKTYEIKNLTKKELTILMACLGRERGTHKESYPLFNRITTENPTIWDTPYYIRISKKLVFSQKY